MIAVLSIKPTTRKLMCA